MDIPVDMTNLRSMTDGDREVETVLFTEFCRAFEEGLAILAASYEESGQQPWRSQAHALKGIALNLGADRLSSLCRQAQEQFEIHTAEKQALLAQLRVAYEEVRRFLEQEMNSN